MKNSKAILAVGSFILSINASAVTITFDDLGDGSTTNNPFPASYNDLVWEGDNNWVLNSSLYSVQSSGYVIGTVSGNNVAVYRNNASVTAVSGTFDFNGAYLTAAWNNGMDLHVEGKLNGATVYSNDLVINSFEAIWYDFNWNGVDQITFASSGGINAGYGGSGAWTAIDNFTVNAVPVPAAVWLFGSGLLSLIGVARCKKAA